MNSPKRILFCANDPGGANAILPVVKALKERGDEILGITTGPASSMFAKAGIDCFDGSGYGDDAIEDRMQGFKPGIFLAGTSIGNSIDKKMFKHLRDCPSLYVIDFWSHYGHRFSAPEADLSHLPTKICVIDERMRRELIREGFPDDRLVVTGNPHFDHFTDSITRDREDASRVLFISQPIKSDVSQGGMMPSGIDEYEVLQHVIAALPDSLHLSIRLHPRDDAHKYDAYLNERVVLAAETSLEEALSASGAIVGMFSPVLMQAALAGKPTISFHAGSPDNDPLPSNITGITKRVTNKNELSAALWAYGRGELHTQVRDSSDLFPKGATARVVATVDSLLSS